MASLNTKHFSNNIYLIQSISNLNTMDIAFINYFLEKSLIMQNIILRFQQHIKNLPFYCLKHSDHKLISNLFNVNVSDMTLY